MAEIVTKDSKKAIAERAIETTVLVGLLKACAVGEIVTYEAMAKALGEEEFGRFSNLHSARRILQNEERVVYGCVRGKGLKRLDDAAVVGTGSSTVQHIHRAARRGARRVVCAEYEKLDTDGKARHNLYASVLGTIAQVTKHKAVLKIETAVRKSQEKLPLGKVLQLYGQKSNGSKDEQ